MTAWIILGSILAVGGVIAVLKIKWNKLVKMNEFLETENQMLIENITVLETENNQLLHAIHAYDELEGSLGEIQRKYKIKLEEYEKLVKNGDNKSSSDAFNQL
jgi:hypothetical protein